MGGQGIGLRPDQYPLNDAAIASPAWHPKCHGKEVNMPKCPRCNEPVDYLATKETRTTGFAVDSDGKPEYDEDLLDGTYSTFIPCKEEYWYCPSCGEILFTLEEEAVHFFTEENKDE